MMVLALSEPNSRLDLSIEGMHSQRFGVGVCVFDSPILKVLDRVFE